MMDAVHVEGADPAQYTEDGRLLSKIRVMRMARLVGEIGGNYQSIRHPQGAAGHMVNMAESMAFTANGIGHAVEHGYGSRTIQPHVLRYATFAKTHENRLSRNETRHRVAVLHSTPSLAFNSRDPHLAVITVEQAFLYDDILFDTIDDAHLDRLQCWDVLVLPGCECMSDDQIDQIKRYLEQGGSVLAIGNVAVMDEWRRNRKVMGLAQLLGFASESEPGSDDPYAREFQDLFGVTPPPLAGNNRMRPPTMCRAVGKGTLFYINEIVLATPRKFPEPSNYNVKYDVVDGRYYYPPRNRAEIVRAVDHLCARQIRLIAPESVICEVTYPQQSELQGQLDVHLINYRLGSFVGQVTVEVEVPAETTVADVRLCSPDFDDARSAAFTQTDQCLRIDTGPLHVYNLLTVIPE